MANIQRSPHFTSDHVHGTGLCFHKSHRRRQIRGALCEILDRDNPLSTRRYCIVSQIHGCRARVFPLPAKTEFQTVRPTDRSPYPHRPPHTSHPPPLSHANSTPPHHPV